MAKCLQFELVLELHGGAMGDGNAWFRQGIRVDRHLNPPLPFLLPLVDDDPILIGSQRFRIRQFHCTDQIFAEQFGRCLGRRAVVDAL